jgi:hypothetical protein
VQIARGEGGKIEDDLLRGAANPTVGWADYLVARAAAEDPKLAPLAEVMLVTLVDQAKNRDWTFLPNLRFDLAQACSARLAPAKKPYPRELGLPLWHATSRSRGGVNETGTSLPWWVAQDGYVAHLAGPGTGLLYFDYPLTGTFEFSVDGYLAPYAQSQFCYGGLVCEANRSRVPVQSGSVFSVNFHDRVFKDCSWMNRDAFNRLTLQVEPGKMRCVVNGQLYFEDKEASTTSPWLALFCRREGHAVFRKPQLQGSPTIPREVRLCQGDRLDGWSAIFYFERLPPRLTPPTANSAPAVGNPAQRYDWSAHNGEIHGRKLDATAALEIDPSVAWYQSILPYLRQLTPEATPSQLQYARPLRARDQLRYEFFYQPGQIMVHPSLGRLAFLLEPDGVRLHWLTAGGDKDWTGLPSDNAIDVPAERRGPAKVPLKTGAWNAVQVDMTDNGVKLELNGTVIYERNLSAEDDRTFGLFHYKDLTAVRVRNVVLTGDWPKTIRPDEFARSFRRAGEDEDAALRRTLIGEDYFR